MKHNDDFADKYKELSKELNEGKKNADEAELDALIADRDESYRQLELEKKKFAVQLLKNKEEVKSGKKVDKIGSHNFFYYIKKYINALFYGV